MRTFSLALILALPLAAADESVLLRGATIHPVAGADIQNGMLLISGGRIAESGVKVAAPKGAKIVDLKGLHVYPGMINSATELGLSEISSVRETQDADEIGTYNPQLRAIIAVNPGSEHFPVTRANGITCAVTVPGGGVLSGQAALLHLDGWTWEDMAVRPSVAMHLRFPSIQGGGGRGGGGFGRGASRTSYTEAKRTYDRNLKELAEFFEQARRYQKAKAAGGAGFKADLKYEAMLPVLDGKQPVMITAVREGQIRDAVDFAEKQKIRPVLAGVRQPGKMAAELAKKNIPVILGNTLALPLEEDDPYDGAATLPGELHKAGVKFAFGTFDVQFARNLPYQVANAVAFGLPYDVGLKSITQTAAEIWGVAGEIGSIEKGKLADLIVTDGDPLETRTQIKQMFIKGRPVDLSNKHLRLYEKYMSRP